MIFRSCFVSINGNNTPDAGICGHSQNVYSVVGATVKILVNGIVCVNSTDYSTFTTSTHVVGTMTVVSSKIQNTSVGAYGIKISIPLINVFDSATVKISVSNAGYYSYNNIFTVFGYDLGNNDTESISGNPDMDIAMLIDHSTRPTQLSAFSKFIAYRQPFTSSILVYNLATVQTFSEVSYSDGTNILGNGNNILLGNNNVQSIEQITACGHYNGNVFVADSICNSDLLVIQPYSLEPCYTINNNVPDCAVDNCGCNGQCIPINDTFTSYAIFQNNLTRFISSDSNVEPFDYITLVYNLFDLSGTLVATETYTIQTLNWNPTSLSYPFSGLNLSNTGDYVLQTILTGYNDLLTETIATPASGGVAEISDIVVITAVIGATYTISSSLIAGAPDLFYTAIASDTPTTIAVALKALIDGDGTWSAAVSTFRTTWHIALTALATNTPLGLSVSWTGNSPIFTCTKVTTIKGCTAVKISRQCNQVTLTNVTLSVQTVLVYNFTSVTAAQLPTINYANYLVQTIVLQPNSSQIVQFPDGWYEFQTQGTNFTCQYELILCNLETCIVNYITKITCASKPSCNCGGNCGKNCDKVSADTYNVNAVMAMLMTWTALIKTNWFFSQVFTTEQFANSLFSSQALSLLQVLSIGDYIAKAQNYCVNCGLGVSGGNNLVKDKDCGCKH